MRILSRKIWRAFPELDQFDDETCKRYITRAKQMKGENGRALLIIFTVVTVFVLMISSASFQFTVLSGWAERFAKYGKVQPFTEMSILIWIFLTGLFVPWLVGLVVRDKILERCVRKQVKCASCPECGYNLIGLSIYGSDGHRLVKCPECGYDVSLGDHLITEADIDPTLLAKY